MGSDWGSDGAVEGDGVAHCLELVESPVLGAFGVEPAEVVGAGVVVDWSVPAFLDTRVRLPVR